jgi:hypothetical protein
MRMKNNIVTAKEEDKKELYGDNTVVNSWKCTRCKRIGKARNDVRGHECPICK